MQALIKAFREVRERTEKELAAASSSQQPELQRALRRIKRQEKAARRMA